MRTLKLALTGLAFAAALPALAQVPAAPEDLRGRALKRSEKPDGWTARLKLGITGSFLASDSVIGQDNGITLQLGALLEANADLKAGAHELDNLLTFRVGFNKTPQLNQIAKALDDLVFQSTYTFNFDDPDWLGPFARFRLNTSALPGYLVRATDQVISRTDVNGVTTTENLPANTRLNLNGAFEPLVLRESLGVFANPVETTTITAKFKLGFGAQQVISRSGYTLADVAATPAIEIVQGRTSVDVGAEAELALTGVIVKDHLLWRLTVNLFQPFTTPAAAAAKNLSGVELMNVELNGGVTAKITSTVGLEYVVLLRRQPLVTDALQVQNSVLLSVAFDLL